MACSSTIRFTYAATFCVSAADPDRHIHTLSHICVILSLARLATYAPVDVRESAARTTPERYAHAKIVVPVDTGIV
ncbi:unnamed protein product [Bathycoccus prasinos]